MATEVIIPAFGVVVEKVKILTWLKSEGDRVEKGEPLLEVESDKVSTEIVSPASGILGRMLYAEGTEVTITHVVALILAEGEAIPASYREQAAESVSAKVPVPPSTPPVQEIRQPVKAVPAARRLAEEKGIDLSLVASTGPHGTIMKKDVEDYMVSEASRKEHQKTSSVARKVAEEFQVSLKDVHGAGVGGRVMKADVLRAAEQSGVLGKQPAYTEQVFSMSKMRQVIARRLSESAFTAPHISLFTDVNMEAVIHLRESLMEEFGKRFNVRLSINDFMIKAAALAIREHPWFNARLKGDEILILPEINIGIAVGLVEGLIVPALPQPDKLSLDAIAKLRTDLVDRARKGKLTLAEIERGTFTLSSLSNFDVTFFTAIINPPQSGILSVGKIQDQLFLENGVVKVKKVATFGLSVDHRIIDGAVAARFLQTFKKRVENPVFCFLDL